MAALRRVVITLVVYAAVAAALLPLLGFLQRGLALPPLFGTLARGLLVAGAVAAGLLAWAYPRLGQGGGEGSDPPQG